ncbi:MAG: ankyrin repeat domain-containing protein [Flavobacteriales bacterium]
MGEERGGAPGKRDTRQKAARQRKGTAEAVRGYGTEQDAPTRYQMMATSLKIAVLTIGLLMSKCSGQTGSEPQRPLLGHDVELFRNTPAWELAQAVAAEDSARIALLCNEDTTLVDFQEPRFGLTLLEWAINRSQYPSAKALCEVGADPNVQSFDGSSAMIHAADNNETSDYLRLLIQYGGDVNAMATPRPGITEGALQLKTPLIAAAGSRLESVKVLVDRGADINYRDKEFGSALMSACLLERIDVVHYLVIDMDVEYDGVLSTTLAGDTLYLSHYLREMTFKLSSEAHRLKMEVVDYLEKHGMSYRNTPIPERYLKKYPKEYLEAY